MIDIGTNFEVVLGNNEWMFSCAGAAGPALEGGEVLFGMRANPGAIERITIDPAHPRAALEDDQPGQAQGDLRVRPDRPPRRAPAGPA